jgi:hypothetical protein
MIQLLWGKLMGRPRILKLKDGSEIHLKNVSPETYEKVKAAALGEGTESTGPEETKTETSKVLAHTAISTYKDKDGWHFVQIKYDPVSNNAEISANDVVGAEKVFSEDKFKIFAVDHDFV